MKKRCVLIITVLTLTFLVTTNARAQWVQDGLASQVIQYLTSNSSTSSAPAVFAAGYGVEGGVFLSTDGGQTWGGDGLSGHDIRQIALSGNNIFVTADYQFGSYVPGVYFSTDEGLSWTPPHAGITDSNFSALSVVDASTPNPKVFVGTDYNGAFRSTDNGTSWMPVNNGLTALWQGSPVIPAVTCFAEVGGSSKALFAGTLFGVYRTSDDGATWEHLTVGFPDSNININVLAISDSNASPPTLLAGTYHHGVFRSTNNGQSWEASNEGPTIIDTCTINALAMSGPMIFAAADSGIFVSNTSGTSWQLLDTSLKAGNWSRAVYGYGITSIAVVGANVIAGTMAGIWSCPLSYFGFSAVGQPPTVRNVLAAFPNPFSASTTFNFSSPEGGPATVGILNAMGTEVARIFSGELGTGEHSFSWDGHGFAPGMYECLVKMGGRLERVPIVLK
jgi:hypothetical protein